VQDEADQPQREEETREARFDQERLLQTGGDITRRVSR
jgi:hypothetical protein